MNLPDLILVRVRLNPKKARALIDACVYLDRRTPERDAELRAEQAAEAEALGLDPYRGDRTDATGTVRPDSGRPVFGWKAEGRQSVSLGCVIQDLGERLAFGLQNVSLLQKPEDRMYFLCLGFKHVGEVERLADLSPRATNEVHTVLGRPYGHLHAFRNQNGSMTINVSHALDPDQVDDSEIRDLRVLKDGGLRCVPRRR